MKACNMCGIEKRTEDFYKSHGKCKPCHLAQMKKYREANPGRIREMLMDWRIRNEGYTFLDKTTGYVQYVGYQHPAASPSGISREHRIVLWDKLEGQNAPCNWCETPLVWGDNLVVDHLNWDRADNRPENLVPSCQQCNTKRRNPETAQGPCQGPQCDRQAESKQYCGTHYHMLWLGRELAPIRPITTEEIRAAMVDDIKAGTPIGTVAKKYNFDIAVVSRRFKRETGMSIREWRRMYKVGVAA